MDQRKKLRNMIGLLKDKASLIRSALLFTSSASASAASRVAVLRATSHNADAPPHEHHVGAVLSLGRGHRLAAHACIAALMDRLHGTRNTSVALKCLIILHGAATARENGSGSSSSSSSSVLRDHLAVFPSSGGHNFLNLSGFRDDSDRDMSAWVRWFAGVLEQNLIASRVLGKTKQKEPENLSGKSNSELLKEIDSLGNFVEQVCDAPESLHLQKNNLVYEVIMLAGNDYSSAQKEIAIRVEQLSVRNGDLSPGDSAELVRALKRLEDYKERLVLLFVNRKRNDSFWDLVGQTRGELVRKDGEREERRLEAVERRDESSDLTRHGARVAGRPEQLFRYKAGGGGRGGGGGSSWLDNDRMALTVSAAG